MNVGEHLDKAAVGLANALGLTRHRAASTDEQITVAVARTRVYQQLHRQLVLIAGPDPQQWDQHIAQFSHTLRGLTAHADRAMPNGLPQVPVRGPVGTALHGAAVALTDANNVLQAHLGDRSTPRSPEGLALTARYRQMDNVTVTGRLAVAALALDERLRDDRWLNPPPASSRRKELLLAVNRDVLSEWRVSGTPTAGEIANAGREERGYARDLAPIPPIHTPVLWTTVTSARHAVAATDAARIFLFHHGGRITANEMAATARAGLDITVNLTEVLAHTGMPATPLDGIRKYATSQWGAAARSLSNLRVDTDPGAPALPVASTALRAVATWLHTRLRTEPDPGSTLRTAGTDRRNEAWRHLAGRIAVRLCDVAQHLQSAADGAQAENRMYRPAGLKSEPGRVIQTGDWLLQASTTDPAFSTVIGSLRDAQTPLMTLASMTGVPMLPGTREAENTQTQRRLQAGIEAERAATAPTRPTAAPTANLPSAGQSPTSPRHRSGGR
jgi:hypothetical protein